MKRAIQNAIRRFHLTFFRRGLPDKLGLYFHDLEPQHHAAFEELIGWVRNQGYLLHDLTSYLSAQGKAAFVSFDDNYRSWFQSLPLLARLQVPCTFYVNSGPLRDRCSAAEQAAYFEVLQHPGERISLSTDELRELRAAGHTIGCHTHWHRPIASLPPSEAHQEIRLGQEILQELLGEPIHHFSFPFGMPRHFNPQLGEYCHQIGLQTIAHATHCQLHRPPVPGRIDRHQWRFDQDLHFNVQNMRIDGRLFVKFTGRSPVG